VGQVVEQLLDAVGGDVGLDGERRPSANSASTRRTAVSCTMRRGQNRACLSAPHAQIDASASDARNAAPVCAAPAANRAHGWATPG